MSIENILDCTLSKKDSYFLLELIHDSLSCGDAKELMVLLEKFKDIIQFDRSVAVLAEVDHSGKLLANNVVNLNYPDEWINIYKQRKYYTVDPVIKELFSSLQMQYWPNTYKKCPAPKEFILLSSNFGLIEGYSYGLKDNNSSRNTIFSFAGENIEANKRTEYILSNIVPHLHNAVIRIMIADSVKKCNISLREQEVLKWVRQGKSSWEISHILGVSERTINFHSSNIMIKLNAVTRTQAVANAMSLGLIGID